MAINRIQLIREFAQRLCQSWEEYRSIHQLENFPTDFLAYLIDENLINPSAIRRYTIMKEFVKYYPDVMKNKTQVVKLLASKYKLSTRSIWTIIRDYEEYQNEIGPKPGH